ncbi:ABC transporter ATP-binding protein [Gemmatimonas sp.]|jgi:heme exporter protein A|uniref:ABC transporter ATP-binding protein n=1 Tax=Gemmatimonas sp. TaxID=1962908 RepID=UPI0022C0928D|nr:ABC transporter ATP-binding protein [Gemmatimonas sp.]MCA2988975.1 ABC transporter ATP-binding protein [Gemmatimonas sp.]MCA2996598.1 ABC transporter ATP-binding protein [Gemmatimonas sp.]MCZ8012434.1 ABC transporter ATP-binding protein [Gemmatimonas sp.]MCZ8268712.1 ABC transporter ATP-binding protein [Gemmatimonas sp.]
MPSPYETGASAVARSATGSALQHLPPAVEAEGLVRAFGGRKAVNGVSLTLADGDCLALFGPNGAGKTTLLRLLGGLLKPTTGTTKLHGVPLPGPAETRRLVGLISHHSMLYPALTVRENVRFAAECQGVVDAEAATTAVLDRLRVLDREHQPVRFLSRGLQQRVSIARALVHGPRLVLLDEPYTGLDEVGALAFTDALRALKAGGATLVLVTHNLVEGIALATRAVIMRQGAFVYDEPTPAGGFDLAEFQGRYRALVHEGLA